MRASDTKSASVPLERELFLFGLSHQLRDSSGQTLYETTSGGKKFSKCFDLKFSTKVQNAASNLLLLHTMLYLSRHQFKFAIKANILLFLLSQFATKGTYLDYLSRYVSCFQLCTTMAKNEIICIPKKCGCIISNGFHIKWIIE